MPSLMDEFIKWRKVSSNRGPVIFRLFESMRSALWVRFGFIFFKILLNCKEFISFNSKGGGGLPLFDNHFRSLDAGVIKGVWSVISRSFLTFSWKKVLKTSASFPGFVTSLQFPLASVIRTILGARLLFVPSITLAVFQAFDRSQQALKSLLK